MAQIGIESPRGAAVRFDAALSRDLVAEPTDRSDTDVSITIHPADPGAKRCLIDMSCPHVAHAFEHHWRHVAAKGRYP